MNISETAFILAKSAPPSNATNNLCSSLLLHKGNRMNIRNIVSANQNYIINLCPSTNPIGHNL
jgi:hypothetical protein